MLCLEYNIGYRKYGMGEETPQLQFKFQNPTIFGVFFVYLLAQDPWVLLDV